MYTHDPFQFFQSEGNVIPPPPPAILLVVLCAPMKHYIFGGNASAHDRRGLLCAVGRRGQGGDRSASPPLDTCSHMTTRCSLLTLGMYGGSGHDLTTPSPQMKFICLASTQ